MLNKVVYCSQLSKQGLISPGIREQVDRDLYPELHSQRRSQSQGRNAGWMVRSVNAWHLHFGIPLVGGGQAFSSQVSDFKCGPALSWVSCANGQLLPFGACGYSGNSTHPIHLTSAVVTADSPGPGTLKQEDHRFQSFVAS